MAGVGLGGFARGEVEEAVVEEAGGVKEGAVAGGGRVGLRGGWVVVG